MPGLSDHVNVELAHVKRYLRVEHDRDDELIQGLIVAAIHRADDEINFDADVDADDPKIMAIVPIAVDRMVASWYQGRADSVSQERLGDESVTYGDVPWSASVLLSPLRRNPGL